MTTPATPDHDPFAHPYPSDSAPAPASAAGDRDASDRDAGTAASMVDRAAGAAKQAERTAREQSRAALDLGHDVVRAGLGVVGAAGEQTARLFHALVDRGARVEDRVVGQARDAVETVKERAADLRNDVGARQHEMTARVGGAVGTVIDHTVAEPLADVLRRAGVPSRAEMRELSTQVALLSAKVDALVARLDAASMNADARPM